MKNKILKELSEIDDDLLPIMDLIPTLEGEGIKVGTPRLLLRLAGCAVGCKWCDTKESWGLDAVRVYSSVIETTKAILDAGYNFKEVSITGGEPLHRPIPLLKLVKALRALDYIVNLETSGTIINTEVFNAFNYVTLDIKTPSSGVELPQKTIDLLIKEVLSKPSNTQIKAVVKNTEDLEWIELKLQDILTSDTAELVLTPYWSTTKDHEECLVNVSKGVNKILEWNNRYSIRILPQVHKTLGFL